MAFCTDLNCASGHCAPSSSTVSVAALATGAATNVPSAATTATHALRPFTLRPTPFDPRPKTRICASRPSQTVTVLATAKAWRCLRAPTGLGPGGPAHRRPSLLHVPLFQPGGWTGQVRAGGRQGSLFGGSVRDADRLGNSIVNRVWAATQPARVQAVLPSPRSDGEATVEILRV